VNVWFDEGQPEIEFTPLRQISALPGDFDPREYVICGKTDLS
jgi:hypothetical protein